MSESALNRLMNAMLPWMDGIRAYPGFSDWKRRSIAHIIDYGERYGIDAAPEHDRQFVFPSDLERQHNAITAFLSLSISHSAMSSTQYYFRRYPFHDLPVGREEHLRYTCEMFFSRVYEFSERMKRCLNLLNETLPNKLDVGKIVKEFAREFQQELRARNQIHHHDRFDEIQLNKVGLLDSMAGFDERNGRDRGWRRETQRVYRAASREWAERAKRRSARAGIFLEAVAQAYLDYADFLKHPYDPSANDRVNS